MAKTVPILNWEAGMITMDYTNVITRQRWPKNYKKIIIFETEQTMINKVKAFITNLLNEKMHCYQIVVNDIEKLEIQCGTIIMELVIICQTKTSEDLKWYILTIISMDMLDTAFVAFLSKLEIESKIVTAKITRIKRLNMTMTMMNTMITLYTSMRCRND